MSRHTEHATHAALVAQRNERVNPALLRRNIQYLYAQRQKRMVQRTIRMRLLGTVALIGVCAYPTVLCIRSMVHWYGVLVG